LNGVSTLTRIPEIRWPLQGVLNPTGDKSDSTILTQVLEWPIFQTGQHRIEPGQLISSRIAQKLQELTGQSIQELTGQPIESLNLLKVVQWQIGSSQVSPKIAQIVSPVLNNSCLETLQDSEKKEIRKFLETLRFRAVDGQWYPACQLLVKEVAEDEDERMLAEFAPDSALLSDGYYIIDNCKFFYACRQSLTLSLETKGNWIRESSLEKQSYCIQYLLNGKYRDDLIKWLKFNLEGTWLAELKSSEQRHDWQKISLRSFEAMLERLGLLKPRDSSELDSDSENDNEIKPGIYLKPFDKPAKPESVLNGILKWWKAEGGTLTKQYQDNLYPSEDLILTKDNYLGDDPSTKERWLVLFMLGTFHSMPFTRTEKQRTHANFLQTIRGVEDCWFNSMKKEEVQPGDCIKMLGLF
jgi:hypothetical protein